MVEIGVNSVVLSLAGRDRGRLFAVVGLETDGYVRLADGRLRSLQKPKKKKLRHLRAVGRLEAEYATDNALHRALRAFAEDGAKGLEGGYQLVEGRCH